MKKLLLFPLLLFVLVACDENNVYKNYEGFSTTLWPKDDAVTYKVNIEDASLKYNIILDLRHASYIKYGEILTNTKITIPSGETLDYGFILKLRDPSGEFLGEAMGGLVDTPTIVAPDFTFPEAGEYTFTVKHGMEEDDLADVISLGLKIDKIVSE